MISGFARFQHLSMSAFQHLACSYSPLVSQLSTLNHQPPPVHGLWSCDLARSQLFSFSAFQLLICCFLLFLFEPHRLLVVSRISHLGHRSRRRGRKTKGLGRWRRITSLLQQPERGGASFFL